ncbi:MAG: HAD family hydrolase [Candidatus Melainabacteria bacterium]|nr:HAD family hydrolase [Candidatus Melainabacteria bacterium]
MSRKCQVPGRNFCAPNGKVAALFVDIDGTILICERNFRRAKTRFGYYMTKLGFDGALSMQLAQKYELAYIHKHGFERDALAKSMVWAYRQLCKDNGVRCNGCDVGICEDIGRSPFFREPELFPNAAPVLARAFHSFRMIAVTIGNREAQKYKIRQAGLATVFGDIIITQRDDKVELVRAAIADLNIDPNLSAFIGNSIRSDGACLAATNFIYLPMEPGWAFDEAELPKDTGFEVFEAKDWREVEEHGINRLMRRRQTAFETAPGHTSVAYAKVNPNSAPRASRLARKRKRGTCSSH